MEESKSTVGKVELYGIPKEIKKTNFTLEMNENIWISQWRKELFSENTANIL